jgi:hypothetical protein
MKHLILCLLLVFLTSCVTVNKIPVTSDGPVTGEAALLKEECAATFDERYEANEIIRLYEYEKVTNKYFSKEVRCLLKQEAHRSTGEALVVGFFSKETGALVQYTIDLQLNMVVIYIFTQLDDTHYNLLVMMSFSAKETLDYLDKGLLVPPSPMMMLTGALTIEDFHKLVESFRTGEDVTVEITINE